MPHRRRPSSSRCRRSRPATALACLLAGLLAGCAPSTPAPPADDSASAAAGPAASTAEELRRRAFADSALRLDSAFSRLRDSLAAESGALSALDRTSAEYARRYDAFVARERDAARLRVRRDSLRALAAPDGRGAPARPARP